MAVASIPTFVTAILEAETLEAVQTAHQPSLLGNHGTLAGTLESTDFHFLKVHHKGRVY